MAETAVVAAQSVAEAVKKVADAAVAEVGKVKPAPQHDFTIGGTPGGGFTIVGSGFGAGGSVLVNGVAVHTTSWNANRIEGTLPAGVKSSDVVVWIDKSTQQRGYLTVA